MTDPQEVHRKELRTLRLLWIGTLVATLIVAVVGLWTRELSPLEAAAVTAGGTLLSAVFGCAEGVVRGKRSGPPEELARALHETTSLADLEQEIDELEINVDPHGEFSNGYGLILDIYGTSRGAVRAWGREPERWMVVEENGELLDTFAKHQRERASDEELAEEAADSIMVAVHACAVEDIPPQLLWKRLILKLGRTKGRVADAGAWDDDEPTEVTER